MTNVCFRGEVCTVCVRRTYQTLILRLLIGLLISAAPLCDNANSVINSAEYNGCHSAHKEPRRDHVFRRQAKITALLMSAGGTKCFHKQSIAFVFPLLGGRGAGAAGCMCFVTQTERDRTASDGCSGSVTRFTRSSRLARLN